MLVQRQSSTKLHSLSMLMKRSSKQAREAAYSGRARKLKRRHSRSLSEEMMHFASFQRTIHTAQLMSRTTSTLCVITAEERSAMADVGGREGGRNEVRASSL